MQQKIKALSSLKWNPLVYINRIYLSSLIYYLNPYKFQFLSFSFFSSFTDLASDGNVKSSKPEDIYILKTMIYRNVIIQLKLSSFWRETDPRMIFNY